MTDRGSQLSAALSSRFGTKPGRRYLAALDRDDEEERKFSTKVRAMNTRLTKKSYESRLMEDAAPRSSAVRGKKKAGVDEAGRRYFLLDQSHQSTGQYQQMFYHTLAANPGSVLMMISIRGKRGTGWPVAGQELTLDDKRYKVVSGHYPDRFGRVVGIVCLSPI